MAQTNIFTDGAAHPNRLSRSMNRKRKIFTPMKVFVINKQYGSAVKTEKFFYSCQTWVVIDTYYFGTSNQKHRTFFCVCHFSLSSSYPTKKGASALFFFCACGKFYKKTFHNCHTCVVIRGYYLIVNIGFYICFCIFIWFLRYLPYSLPNLGGKKRVACFYLLYSVEEGARSGALFAVY